MKSTLILLALFLSMGTIPGQNSELPEALEISDFVSKNNTSWTTTDKIYPVGWSKDGLFAYIVSPAVEDLRGEGRMLDFYIFDAVNDKVVFSKSINTYRYIDEGFECNTDDMACAWRDVNYGNVLKTNEIVKISTLKLDTFPITTDTEVIDIQIIDNKLFVKSSVLGIKRVTPKFAHLKIAGYLKSPFENRLLIIAYQAIREQDPEGPDSFYYRNEFSFFGCHLGNGFPGN
jgi:hypothetical protein